MISLKTHIAAAAAAAAAAASSPPPPIPLSLESQFHVISYIVRFIPFNCGS